MDSYKKFVEKPRKKKRKIKKFDNSTSKEELQKVVQQPHLSSQPTHHAF